MKATLEAAAWRALYQLIAAPYYWEKTEHGLAKHSRRAVNLTRSMLQLERYMRALKLQPLPQPLPDGKRRSAEPEPAYGTTIEKPTAFEKL